MINVTVTFRFGGRYTSSFASCVRTGCIFNVDYEPTYTVWAVMASLFIKLLYKFLQTISGFLVLPEAATKIITN